jgi:hypothetical protein
MSRSSFEFKLRTRTEGIGLEPPSYFEFVEVARIDLIERRVTVIAEITGVGGPFPIGGARLAEDCSDQSEAYQNQAHHGTSV